jgi:hypothetical protein
MKGEFTQKGRETMDRFKMEAASEVGVNLSKGYNGDITAREAGSVGGQMVKHICPERQYTFKRKNMRKDGHISRVKVVVFTGI